MKISGSLVLTCVALVTGCTFGKPLNPYTGLFPQGYEVKVAAPPSGPTPYKDKTVAIVVSKNFEKYVASWKGQFEQGGEQRGREAAARVADLAGQSSPAFAAGMNMALESNDGSARQVSDPRRITDAVLAMMKRNFKSVIVADDFADAQDKHADYVALVDFTVGSKVSGIIVADQMVSWGGVYMHDAKLSQIFKVENKSQGNMGVFMDTFGALNDAMNSTVEAIRKGLASNLAPGAR